MHGKHFFIHFVEDHVVTVQSIFCWCVLVTDLCSSFLDHFQLTFVDLDAPEETIKESKEDPPCQPEEKEKGRCRRETKL